MLVKKSVSFYENASSVKTARSLLDHMNESVFPSPVSSRASALNIQEAYFTLLTDVEIQEIKDWISRRHEESAVASVHLGPRVPSMTIEQYKQAVLDRRHKVQKCNHLALVNNRPLLTLKHLVCLDDPCGELYGCVIDTFLNMQHEAVAGPTVIRTNKYSHSSTMTIFPVKFYEDIKDGLSDEYTTNLPNSFLHQDLIIPTHIAHHYVTCIICPSKKLILVDCSYQLVDNNKIGACFAK